MCISHRPSRLPTIVDTEVNEPNVDYEPKILYNTNFHAAKMVLSDRSQLILRTNICHGPSRAIKSILMANEMTFKEIHIDYMDTLQSIATSNPDRDGH